MQIGYKQYSRCYITKQRYINIICCFNAYFYRMEGSIFKYIRLCYNKFVWYKRHFTNILKSPLPNMLKQIIEDKSLLINEITPDNFDEFMKKLIEEGALEFDYKTLAGKPKDGAPLGDGTGAKDEK